MKSRLFQLIVGITFLLFIPAVSKAQLMDSTNTDTSVSKLSAKKHSPRKAALMSTACPGLGQIYNKKYWKLPIIYGGVGGLIYSFQFNESRYVKYRNAYRYRLDGDPSTVDNYVGKYSDDNLNTLQSYYHHYRDLSVIGFAALYLLNVVDANVDAHLFNFDVSDDLSLNIRPTLINTAGINHYSSGLSLNIKF